MESNFNDSNANPAAVMTALESGNNAFNMPPVAATFKLASFKKGSYIIVEDKKVPDHFYIIMEGRVALSKELVSPIKNKTRELGPGDFFGMISTMSGHSQIETAQALTDVVLMPVQYDNFSKFIQDNVPMVNKILMEFSRLIRYLDNSLAELTFKKSSTVSINHLFHIAEYYKEQRQFDTALCAFNKFIEYCPNDKNIDAAKQYLEEISVHVTTETQYIKTNDLTRVYPKNTIICAEGEPGDEIFFIQRGMVKISKVVENNEILLAILSKGDIFGEMSFIESKPRGASAIAYGEAHVMTVNHANFGHLIKTQPLLISRLTSLLTKRIWIIYKMITNTKIEDPLGRMLDMLFIQLEKKRVKLNVKKQYVFDFGTKELINMIGLPSAEGGMVIQKLLKNKYIGLIQDKIAIMDMFEFFKQVNFYRPKR